MPIDRSKLAADYYIVVTPPTRTAAWEWEIRRRSKPMPVKIRGGQFESENEARAAGEKALNDFLDRVVRT
jgi:hypothetical protein